MRAAELKAVMYFCSMQRRWIEGIGDVDGLEDGEGTGIGNEVLADII